MSSANFVKGLNYLFIFLAINYTILVRFVIGVDSAGYGLSLVSILVVLFNYKDFNRLQNRKPIIFWLLWCLYAFLNYYLHPHVNPITVFVLYKRIFVPLILMTVVVKEFEDNPNKLLWLCFITQLVFVIFGVYFDRGLIYSSEGVENELGNNYAIVSCFTLFYLMLLNRTKKIPILLSMIIVALVLIVISLVGTRKAFGASLIILVFWLYSFLNIKKLWTWFIVGLFVFLGVKSYQMIIENTYVGVRMEGLEKQQEEALPAGAPAFLSVFGDRAAHYYYGWKSFMDNPVLGVGTGQSRVGSKSYIHTEYIVQLSDGGIIGFMFFFMFIFWVVSHIFKRAVMADDIRRCMFGGVAAILFLYLTTWGWEFPQYFVCFGVLIGYCNKNYSLE